MLWCFFKMFMCQAQCHPHNLVIHLHMWYCCVDNSVFFQISYTCSNNKLKIRDTPKQTNVTITMSIVVTVMVTVLFQVLWAKGTQYFADLHVWFSTLTRPSYSRFTRAQRLTCCLSLLMSYLAVNAAWYKTSMQEVSFSLHLSPPPPFPLPVLTPLPPPAPLPLPLPVPPPAPPSLWSLFMSSMLLLMSESMTSHFGICVCHLSHCCIIRYTLPFVALLHYLLHAAICHIVTLSVTLLFMLFCYILYVTFVVITCIHLCHCL